MEYSIRITPLAKDDLNLAVLYWNQQREGLGKDLISEVYQIFEVIKSDPELFQKRYKNLRVGFTKRFSYGIHYTIESDLIYIHTIFHTSRKPRE